MDFPKPWKADSIPVNYPLLLVRLVFKLFCGFVAAYLFTLSGSDSKQATGVTVGVSGEFLRSVGILIAIIALTFAYVADDVLLLLQSKSPKATKQEGKGEKTKAKPSFDIGDLMGPSMQPVSPQPTRSFHGLASPTSFSPEPPRTSPVVIQSLANRLAGSLLRRKVPRGKDVTSTGPVRDVSAADEVSEGGTWTQSPFRNENMPPYAQYTPDASLGEEGIPKYHYSLAWTRVDSRGVMKPVLSMRSQPWRSDKYVSVDRKTLWTFSERARVWVVKNVLQAFMQRLASVSEGIKKHKLGLPPLLPEDLDWERLRPDSAMASGHLQYCQSALDGIKRQLQQAQQSAAAFQQQQQAQQLAQLREQHKAARQHLQILRDYQGLCKVLQGTLPGVALGTPVPPAVLAKRVAELSESCCQAPSPDHDQATISDCEVVLYFAGAFLQAPFWRFEASTQDGSSFQVVPNADGLTSRRMAFVLCSAAGDVSNVEAGIEFCHRGLGGQHSWTQEQSATLIVRGIRCFERTGSWACFELLALFFALVEAEFGGKIGPNGLQYLQADAIVAPVKLPRQEPRWTWPSFFH